MGTLGLIAGFALPWLVGTIFCFRIGSRSQPGAWALRLGYGYVIGLLLATLVLRGMNAAGAAFSFPGAAAILIALAAVLLAPWSRVMGRIGPGRAPAELAPPAHGEKILIGVLLSLLAFHAATILLELIARPLFPWDAWTQWATKAKVWVAEGRIVPFLPPDEWLAHGGPGAYTDAASHYPTTVPLFQVWTAVGLGRWDEALVNLPWFGLWMALVLAVYGHARAWPLRASVALAVAYAVASLPFVNVHAMLAGYADLPQAVVFTLAALAVVAWARTRATHHAVMALLCVLACPFIKQPGIVWVATLAPALLIAWKRRLGSWIVAIGVAVGAVLLMVLAWSDVVLLGYRLRLEFKPVWAPLAANLFLYGNWSLLFWLFPVALALGARRAVSKEWLPCTVTITLGAMFLFVVFFFTSASAWVEDQTTVNRAVFHLAPLIAFFTAVLIGESLVDRAESRDSARMRRVPARAPDGG